MAGGNLENERVAEGEAPVHDGVEEVKERIGGPGSNARHNSLRSQPQSAHMFLSSVFLLVDLLYVH